MQRSFALGKETIAASATSSSTQIGAVCSSYRAYISLPQVHVRAVCEKQLEHRNALVLSRQAQRTVALCVRLVHVVAASDPVARKSVIKRERTAPKYQLSRVLAAPLLHDFDLVERRCVDKRVAGLEGRRQQIRVKRGLRILQRQTESAAQQRTVGSI